MKAEFPPINIKFGDRLKYYDKFEAYYSQKDSGPMENLFAEYLNERLDDYLRIIKYKTLLEHRYDYIIIASETALF